MRNRPKNFAHVSLFADRVAPVIGALLTDVVILGLLGVAYNYVKVMQQSEYELYGSAAFYKRMFLLIWVLAFAAYNALCYHIYLEGFKDNEANREAGRFQYYAGTETPRASSTRVILLFILDLAQVAISAFLFAGLVPHIEENSSKVAALFVIPAQRWWTMFGLLTAWHCVIYLWYGVWAWEVRYEGSRRRLFWSKSHASFALLYFSCALGAWVAGSHEQTMMTLAGVSVRVGNVIDAVGLLVLLITLSILYGRQLRQVFDDMHGEGEAGDQLPEDISATAFLVNESRARRLDIAQDRFAKDWIPPTQLSSVLKLWDDFAREVYPHDDIEIALRNRFFLEHLNRAAREKTYHFISLGAGFTSYPFLLQREQWRSFLEADLPAIINAKKNRMRQLIDQQILPPVDVEFREANLRDISQIDALMRRIAELTQARSNKTPASNDPANETEPTFILFEGVSYYLTDPSLNHLLECFAKIQSPGSLLALDYWPANAVDYPAFQRQQTFFADKLGFGEQDYSFLEHERLQNLPGYEVVEFADVTELEAKYCRSRVLSDENQIIPESLAILQRTATDSTSSG